MERYLDYLQKTLVIGFEAIDKKESSIHEQLQRLNSSNELVQAVKSGDIPLAKQILDEKPMVIAS